MDLKKLTEAFIVLQNVMYAFIVFNLDKLIHYLKMIYTIYSYFK